MPFDTRVPPMVGLPLPWAGWPLRPQRQPDRRHPTAAVVVIDGRVAHRLALTVSELPGS